MEPSQLGGGLPAWGALGVPGVRRETGRAGLGVGSATRLVEPA